ncbi:tetratricopeptide repeat protein [Streptomyces sp. PTD9-10]|uniref:tetratricopeptide repeat protein n=1 Tax=Streptomyces sp. PTD9-10 TaxID=3120151 RepID=UPI003008FE52
MGQPERLVVDLSAQGQAGLMVWRSGKSIPGPAVDLGEMRWPLPGGALEDLRWYLEEYLRTPFGVYEERGARVKEALPGWGREVFAALFGTGPGREAFEAARDRAESGGRGLEVVLRSDAARWLGLPWEIMAAPDRPNALALDGVAFTRSLLTAKLSKAFRVSGGRLRVLMVISRPGGTDDVGYQVVAGPLLQHLITARGRVELTVLRPPTLERLMHVLLQAREAGEPFQVVHFDGHGVFSPQSGLVFERDNGARDLVRAEDVAQVLAEGGVPLVVLNACQSATIGGQVEAAVATRLLQGGADAVVAMAYSVYAVAAAEFMAAFYERLFAGDPISVAVGSGRRQLMCADLRPSPKGPMPLADWMVPVLYVHSDIAFPDLRTERPPRRSAVEPTETENGEADRAGIPSQVPAAGIQRSCGEEDEQARVLARTRAQPNDSTGGGAAGAGTDWAEDVWTSEGEFVGRHALQYTLDRAAWLEKVVVLHGPGGSGKTELAKAFGRWSRDTGALDSPEYLVWHSFEPGDARFGLDGVLDSVGRALYGRGFSDATDPDDRLREVEDALKQKRVLMVWDNFESAHTMPDPASATDPLDQNGRDRLLAFLDHVTRSRSAVVITSRTPERWLGQVRRILVPGLDTEEASAYADHLLAPHPAARSHRDRRAFGELMHWLDGHPLSMRLILPHLGSRTPEHILTTLRDTASDSTPDGRAELLGSKDDGRNASLASSIAYSHTCLPAADQILLSALALHHGTAHAITLSTFSAEPGVPARFAGHTIEDWQGVLERAAAVGLLMPMTECAFRIHPALPAYLAHRWLQDPDGSAEEMAAARQALLHAHAGLSRVYDKELGGSHAEYALGLVHVQRRTLASLLGHALDHGLWSRAKDIFAPLTSYWRRLGLSIEAQGWIDRALTALEEPEGTPPALDTEAGGLWLFLTGHEAIRHQLAGRLDQAEKAHTRILQTLQTLPPSHQQARDIATAKHGLGTGAADRGDLKAAEAWYGEALTAFEHLNDRSGTAMCHHSLGRVAQGRGDLEAAEAWYGEALTAFKHLNDRPSTANCHHQLGLVTQLRGDLDTAETHFHNALIASEDLNDRPSSANCYYQLGSVAQLRGDLDIAETYYQDALTVFEDLDDRPSSAICYHQLGLVAMGHDDLATAEAWYSKALTAFEHLDDRPHTAGTLRELGTVALMRKDFDAAETHLGKALTAFERLDDRPGMSLTYMMMGWLAEDRERREEALVWLVRCVTCFATFPHPMTGPGLEDLARLAKNLGMDAVEAAWHTVTETGLPQVVRAYLNAQP